MKLVDSGVTPVCCGEDMTELVPGTTDGDKEKHLPVVTRLDNGHVRVEIGSKEHPMSDEHYIRVVVLETTKGILIRELLPGDRPFADFCTCCERVIAAYEYCNLHGLWKTEMKPFECHICK